MSDPQSSSKPRRSRLSRFLRAIAPPAIALIPAAGAMIAGHADDFLPRESIAIGILAWLGTWLMLWWTIPKLKKDKNEQPELQPGLAEAPTKFVHQVPTKKTKQDSDVEGQQNVAPQVVGDHANITILQHAQQSSPSPKPGAGDPIRPDPPVRRHVLPAKNPDFIGREEEIEKIRVALNRDGAAMTAIDGMGKTEIGIEVANRLRDEELYPGGVPFVDLQGVSVTREPLSTREALVKLLEQLVVLEARPIDDQELRYLWKQACADRQMLLFLDNAHDEAQIRPLLPGHHGCKVLITSRSRLDLDGIEPIGLSVMAQDNAAKLAHVLGNRWQEGRVNWSKAAKLAKLCGCHPLSIRVAAANLGKAQILDVDDQLKKLASVTRNALNMEEVKAVLGLSLDQLTPECRSAWQRLGVFEGDFSTNAAADIIDRKDAEEMLAELEQRNLVNLSEQRRLQLHDVLRALALDSIGPDELKIAEALHAQHYYRVIADADLASRTEAFPRGFKMYQRELRNLLAAEQWIAENFATDDIALELARGLSNFEVSRYFVQPRQRQIEQTLLSLKAGNDVGLAVAALDQADRLCNPRAGNPGEPILWYERSRTLFRKANLREGLADASSRLGSYLALDSPMEAEDLLEEAAQLYEALGWNSYLGTQLLKLSEIKYRLDKIREGRKLYVKGNAALEAYHGPKRQAMAQRRHDLIPKEETEHTRLIDHWKHQLHDIRSMTPEIWDKEICNLPCWPEIDCLLPITGSNPEAKE